MERAQDTTAVPDFATVDERDWRPYPVKWHTIVNEWTTPIRPPRRGTKRPARAARCSASARRRTQYFHPLGDLQFNPLASPGDPDYGLMYISGGDWGYINGAGAPQGSGNEGQPGQLQRLDTLAGTLLRIDPRSPAQSGGQAGIGDYTIPAEQSRSSTAIRTRSTRSTPSAFATAIAWRGTWTTARCSS